MASTIAVRFLLDKLTLPAGGVWYRGSLHVVAPPDLIRLTDTDRDGVADQREVIVTDWHLPPMPPVCTAHFWTGRLALSHGRPARL